jgi:hypothetical protein
MKRSENPGFARVRAANTALAIAEIMQKGKVRAQ